MSLVGTLLPRANPAACPQLAKADFASSSQQVREGQRIAALDAEIDALQRQALALDADTSDLHPVLLGVKVANLRLNVAGTRPRPTCFFSLCASSGAGPVGRCPVLRNNGRQPRVVIR
jgi:hypothetical protein